MKADSAIKLFGKTISLRVNVSDSPVTVQKQTSSSQDDTKSILVEDALTEGTTVSETGSDDLNRPPPSSSGNTSKDEQDQGSESSACQDRTVLKKPDKIVPCPRCNSDDTKFCYYNNYNVNQPRHFCKNCQRYWTSGGAMRNVPVGSGRRKNKSLTIPSYRHIVISDALQMAAVDGIHSNGFLVFGSNRPICGPLDGPDLGLRNSGVPITFYRSTPFWGSNMASNGSIPGKRSREEVVLGLSEKEKRNRLDKGEPMSGLGKDGPNEAAKSCIWSALESKNHRFGFGCGPSLFRPFNPKGSDHRRGVARATTVLEANPAALSRSLNFHENV